MPRTGEASARNRKQTELELQKTIFEGFEEGEEEEKKQPMKRRAKKDQLSAPQPKSADPKKRINFVERHILAVDTPAPTEPTERTELEESEARTEVPSEKRRNRFETSCERILQR